MLRGCEKPTNFTKVDLALNFSGRRNATPTKVLQRRGLEGMKFPDVACLHSRLGTERLMEVQVGMGDDKDLCHNSIIPSFWILQCSDFEVKVVSRARLKTSIWLDSVYLERA